MTSIHGTSAVPIFSGGVADSGAPVSEVPASASGVSIAEVVPHPAVEGGVDDLPKELFSPDERLTDELDHAGLDQVLPEEDHVRAGGWRM
jgi:hypothetical protein